MMQRAETAIGKYVEQDMLRTVLIFSGAHVADEEDAGFRPEPEQGCIYITTDPVSPDWNCQPDVFMMVYIPGFFPLNRY